MERKLTKLEHSHTEVLVTVDQKTWKDAQKKAFDKQAANVTIDGFRKGNAPESLVRKHVDGMKVIDDAINSLLPEIYRQIIEEDGLRPYARPAVEITKVSDTELEVKFTITTAPEVKLGAYKGLKVGHGDVKVEDADVDAAIASLLANNASLVIKEDAAKEGDTVVIDFLGKVNGEAFEGGTAQNYELELGSHSFIPGFEEQLVGHKAGEHVDVNVKFPENYVENLKGKEAVFECDIHEVKEKKLPELNDEFVKELNIKGVETVEQLKANKRSEIEENKKQEERREYVGKLLDEIVKDSEVDVAEEIIDNQVENRKEDMEKRMGQSGLNLKQYLEIIGQTEEQFTEQLRKDARKDVERYVVVEEIGKAEKFEIEDADVEFELARLADQYNMKIEDVRKAIASQLDQFKNEILNRRIEEFLVNNNE